MNEKEFLVLFHRIADALDSIASSLESLDTAGIEVIALEAADV